MSLLDALRAGVKVADNVTKLLQTTVQYEHCNGQGAYGPTYDLPVSLLAIFDEKQQLVRTKGGELSASRGVLTFLDVAAMMAATGADGEIRDVDILRLPNGVKVSIIAVGGFSDAGTGHPVAMSVWIG